MNYADLLASAHEAYRIKYQDDSLFVKFRDIQKGKGGDLVFKSQNNFWSATSEVISCFDLQKLPDDYIEVPKDLLDELTIEKYIEDLISVINARYPNFIPYEVMLPWCHFGSYYVTFKESENLVEVELYGHFESLNGRILLRPKTRTDSVLEALLHLEIDAEPRDYGKGLIYHGIDSIKLVYLEAEIQKRIADVSLEPAFLLKCGSINDIFNYVESSQNDVIRSVLKPKPFPLTPQQKRILAGIDLNPSESLQFLEFVDIRTSSDLKCAINDVIMNNVQLRVKVDIDEQFLLSGTECHVTMVDSEVDTSTVTPIMVMKHPDGVTFAFNHFAFDAAAIKSFFRQLQKSIDGIPMKLDDRLLRYSESYSISEDSERYWTRYLEGCPKRIESSQKTMAVFEFLIPEKVMKKAAMLQRKMKASVFEIRLAYLSLAIRKVFNTEICIGVASDRRTSDYIDVIGCFTNILPIRINGSDTFDLFADAVIESLRQGKIHGDVQLPADIVDILIVSDSWNLSESCNLGFQKAWTKIPKYDIVWYFRNNKVFVEYNGARYSESLIKSISDGFLKLLNVNPGNLDRMSLGSLKPPRKVDFFEVAIPTSKKEEVIYTLEMLLFEKFGILSRNDNAVLLTLNRGRLLIDVVRACWFLGIPLLPLHQSTPATTMVDVQAKLNSVLLEDNIVLYSLPRKMKHFQKAHQGDVAYITMTSGSTGVPKMVYSEWCGLKNLAQSYTNVFKICSSDRICQVVNPCFDIFFADVAKAEVNCAELILCESEIFSDAEIQKSTLAYIMPAVLGRLTDFENLGHLRFVQFGGEKLSQSAFLGLQKLKIKMIQEYGLTEQSVYSTYSDRLEFLGQEHQNLGLEFRDVDGAIAADECFNSRIFLTGRFLMRGYFNTTVPPVSMDSGDIAHRTVLGSKLIGRLDRQVKVRGHRIDLGDVETILSKDSGAHCVCSFVDGRIIAFLEGSDEVVERNLLPFQKPWRVVRCDEFPLTRTGKVDRKQLETRFMNVDSVIGVKNVGAVTAVRNVESVGNVASLINVESVENVADIGNVENVENVADLGNVESVGNMGNVAAVNNVENVKITTTSLESRVKFWLKRYSDIDVHLDDDFSHVGIDSIALSLTAQQLRKEGFNIATKMLIEKRTLRRLLERRYIKMNHIQKRIFFLSRLQPEKDTYVIKFKNVDVSLKSWMMVKMGNLLLRSFIYYEKSEKEHVFGLLSGTECYGFDHELDHTICDNRSFTIIMDQLRKADAGIRIDFENHFDHDSDGVIDTKLGKVALGKVKRLESKVMLSADSEDFLRAYRASLSSFLDRHSIQIGVTFRNRTKSNWNTVGLFSNTVPTMTSIQDAKSFSNHELRGGVEYCMNYLDSSDVVDDVELIPSSFSQFKSLLIVEKSSEREFNVTLELDELSFSDDDLQVIMNLIRSNLNGSLEDKIVEIYQEVLEVETSSESHFFNLGGHSLMAMRVIDLISEHLGRPIPMQSIFENPTPRGLAGFLGDDGKSDLKKTSNSSPNNSSSNSGRSAVDSERSAMSFGRSAVDSERSAFDSGRHTMNSGRSAVDSERAAVDYGRPTTNSGRSVVDYGRSAMNSGISTVDSEKYAMSFGRSVFDSERHTMRSGRSAVDSEEPAVDPERPTMKSGISAVDSDVPSGTLDNPGKFSKPIEIPLSPQQQQMYYLDLLTDSCEYQLPFVQGFSKSQNTKRLHAAFLCTIQEQSIFRTRFMSTVDGSIVQVVLSITEAYLALQPVYSGIVKESINYCDVEHIIERLCHQRIPATGVPVRADIVVSQGGPVAVLHLHHIISDARSTALTNRLIERFLLDPTPRRLEYEYADYCLDCDVPSLPDGSYVDSLLESACDVTAKMCEASRVELLVRKDKISTGFTAFVHFVKLLSTVSMKMLNLESINIAFPYSNRSAKVEHICGYFLNNLVIRVNLDDDLKVINSRVVEALAANVSYSTLLSEARKKKDVTLANVYINCRYEIEFDPNDDPTLLSLVPLKCHFPIEFDIDTLPHAFKITIRSSIIDVKNCAKLLRDSEEVLKGAIKDITNSSFGQLLGPNGHLSEAKMMSDVVRQSFLEECGRFPRADDILAVIGGREPDIWQKVLSVVFSGCAYLPIHKRTGEFRKNELLALCQGESKSGHGSTSKFKFFNYTTSSDLAYLIPTSGSTGKPKSVCIAGESVVNLARAATEDFQLNCKDVVLQFTSFQFDNSVLETVMAWVNGASLRSREVDFFDPSELKFATQCLLFPSLVQSFNTDQRKLMSGLKNWIVGGEKLPQNLLDDLSEVRIIQNYGPTETTAYVVSKKMKKSDVATTIGSPIMNTEVRIINDVLHLRGTGLMRGYHGTATTSPWYCSGDFCKIDNDRVIFIGRSDNQVKVRGYRIDLSEIDNVISMIPNVLQSKTIFHEEKQQVLSFILAEHDVAVEQLKKHCQERLEAHKVPNVFHVLDRFPLTANSKVDVQALLKIFENSRTSSIPLETNVEDVRRSSTGSTSERSSDVSSIWRRVLGHSDFNDQSNFYQVGGHSLLLIKLKNLLEMEFKVTISMKDLLSNLKLSEMEKFFSKRTLILFPALYGGCTAYQHLIRHLRNYDVILLKEESAASIDELAEKYAKQIPTGVKIAFLGASAAGSIAYATSTFFDDVIVFAIDSGTFYEKIEDVSYSQHRNNLEPNMKSYGLDPPTIQGNVGFIMGLTATTPTF